MKPFTVMSKSRKFDKQARLMETLINQPSVIELVERRVESHYKALAQGLSDAEACNLVGLDPTKPASTYGDR